MTSKELLSDLMAHMEWADAALWGAVLECDGAPDDERLRFLLHHIHLVQRSFRLLWRGEEVEYIELDTFADTKAIAAWGREAHANVRQWLDDATDDQLANPLLVPWTERFTERLGRPAENATVGESVLQLALHSAHHRGQAATRLSEVGGTPPLNDFIIWIWSGRPATEW